MSVSKRFLHPEAIGRIARLDLRARHVVEGFLSGIHRSPYFGQSVEFVQHREYVAGDDPRRIDWKVWSKTDKYYIKQYEEETNLRCTLLVDVSESMQFGTQAMTKYEYGCTIAASLACKAAIKVNMRLTTEKMQWLIDELMKTQDTLYNGRYFQASEDEDHLNMSSLGPIYPMRVIPSLDPRAINTVQAFVERYTGRSVGHGGSESAFPWAAGVLATIFALQGNGDAAWATIETARPAICRNSEAFRRR